MARTHWNPRIQTGKRRIEGEGEGEGDATLVGSGEGQKRTDGYLAKLAPNGVEVGVRGAFEQEAQLRSDIGADRDHLAVGERRRRRRGRGALGQEGFGGRASSCESVAKQTGDWKSAA